MIPLQIIVFLYTIAYHLLSIPGFFPIKVHPLAPEQHRFAIIIPAHNESRVIAHLIDSLKKQYYNSDLYQIFVIADNCTDNTADIARENGATVYERHDLLHRSKGHALRWFFEILWQHSEKYDAVIIFDADNLAHPKFLAHMNDHMAGGEKIIQGYIESKNPEDSWVASAFSLGFWVANRLLQLSRYNWGVSTSLFGTGMCISCDIIHELGWSSTSLTEDLEFSMEAILHGHKVTWAHEAVTFDERATTLKACWNQQLRWQQGRIEVMLKYMKPMLRGCLRGDADKLEALLNIFSPVFILFSGLLGFCGTVSSFIPSLNYTKVLPTEVFTIFFALQLVLPMIIILIDRRPIRYLLLAPYYLIYMTFWVPVTIAAILSFRKRTWTHTSHKADIRIEDLELKLK